MDQFTTSLAVTILIGGVNAYQTYLTRKQLKLQAEAMDKSAKKAAKVTLVLPWKYAYGPTLVMAALMALSWIPYFVNKPIARGELLYILEHGTDTPFNANDPRLRVTANGSLLLSYRDSYHVAAVGFHYYGTGDIKDAPGLQKSELYDIENGPIVMRIKPDAQFIEAANRERGTSYALLLVPKNVQMDQFSVLRQAESIGVIILQTAAGPP